MHGRRRTSATRQAHLGGVSSQLQQHNFDWVVDVIEKAWPARWRFCPRWLERTPDCSVPGSKFITRSLQCTQWHCSMQSHVILPPVCLSHQDRWLDCGGPHFGALLAWWQCVQVRIKAATCVSNALLQTQSLHLQLMCMCGTAPAILGHRGAPDAFASLHVNHCFELALWTVKLHHAQSSVKSLTSGA